jgi:NADPH-dependent curcumin reductase CurA
LVNLVLKHLMLCKFSVSNKLFSRRFTVESFTKRSVGLNKGIIRTQESITVSKETTAGCYLGMFTGENFGKTVLRVADLD